jgi:hypothetical protein
MDSYKTEKFTKRQRTSVSRLKVVRPRPVAEDLVSEDSHEVGEAAPFLIDRGST